MPGYTERWCYQCGQVVCLIAYQEEHYPCPRCNGKTEARENRARVIHNSGDSSA
jgi:hypothetical protein